MQLTTQNIIGYLTDRQLISRESVLNGELYWRQLRSRNQIFVVKNLMNKGLFVKQAKNNVPLLQKEATVLHVLQHFSDFEPVKSFVPQFHSYDPELHILVTEFLEDAQSVLDITEQRGQLSLSQARAMSEVMARFHADLRDDLDRDPSLQFFDRELPWILKLPSLTEYTREVVLTQIKEDEFLINRLDEVARNWTQSSLIHGDVDLNNFMVQELGSNDQLKLTDWEMANVGDPLWDLAGLMQAYMAQGLRFVSNSSDHDHLPESKAHWSKERVHETWATIWECYARCKQWSQTEARQAADKVVGFIAARLLQSAAELNRVSPEFLAPGAWAMIAEAKVYLRQPQDISHILETSTRLAHEV